MRKQREALEMALKAMDETMMDYGWYAAKEAIKEALAEPEQEPTTDGELYAAFLTGLHSKKPARKPLTDEDISTIVQSMSAYTWDAHMLARAIERAHGIGD